MKLADIKKLIEASTPGPWPIDFSGDHPTVWFDTPSQNFGAWWGREDAAFVIASRTLMPKLLAVAEAAKALRSLCRELASDLEGEYEVADKALEQALTALEAE